MEDSLKKLLPYLADSLCRVRAANVNISYTVVLFSCAVVHLFFFSFQTVSATFATTKKTKKVNVTIVDGDMYVATRLIEEEKIKEPKLLLLVELHSE